MEEQHQSTLKETTQTTTSEEMTSDKSNTVEHSTLPRRDSDPHWLLNELNEILEKGMFKHD